MKPFIKGDKLTVGCMSFKQYLSEVAKIPLLSEHEEFEYAMKAKDGDEDAIRILIECNLRFVISVAKRYADTTVSVEDLINVGNIGLIMAVERYDPTKGFKLISYAVWWIRQQIVEYKNEHSRGIKLPSNKSIHINKYKDAYNALEQELERAPVIEEIAQFMDLPTRSVLSLIELDKGFMSSLDRPIDEDGGTMIDLVPSEAPHSDGTIQLSDRKKILDNLLKTLKPKEETIIRLSFGLGEHKPMTLQEIGEMLGISREGVRQKKDRALWNLKRLIKNKKIDIKDIFKIG